MIKTSGGEMNTDWLMHRMIWRMRTLRRHKIKLEKYYDKKVHDIDATNEKISELIMSQKPFMVGRFGSTELATMVAYQKECKNNFLKKRMKRKIIANAGFFPDDSTEIKKFVSLMEHSCNSVDLLGVWNNEMEDYIVNKYCREDCWLGKLAGLEPWYSPQNPWSRLLYGKRVVFVHPFEATMKKQWEVRDKLFESTLMLPKFDLRIVKAVQTIAGNKDNRFCSWFVALEHMFKEVMSEEFDIAIIGCGAYGFPLAAKIKDVGKPAIHLGGATQLFMGIKGRRWEKHPIISKMFNEYWTRPLPEDVPQNSVQVEKGCYW